MTEAPKIQIYIVCHKPTFVPEDPLLIPVQAGAGAADIRYPDMQYDDEGVHISQKNPRYCELTVQYWAWKNRKSDYYGFFHYRRYLSFSDLTPVDREGKELLSGKRPPYIELDDIRTDLSRFGICAETMREQIVRYDLVTVYRERINTTVYRQFCQYHRKEWLDQVLEIVRRKHPEYDSAIRQYMNSKSIYYMNMYIMKRELFEEYMGWLFGILDEFERECDTAAREEPRLMGYLAERLFGVFYVYQRAKGVRCAETPYLLFYDTDPEGEGKNPTHIRSFRLKPTKLEVKVDMRRLNRLFPAGSLRRRLLRGTFLR
ncbi:MAG: DUF4422 domain-containing protein [Clostridiales bacterium]|nr:DUF4422 domain-containing protein [Clostridiales bacterium]